MSIKYSYYLSKKAITAVEVEMIFFFKHLVKCGKKKTKPKTVNKRLCIKTKPTQWSCNL